MPNITITQEVREVNITIEQSGQSYTLQPVLVVGGASSGVQSVTGNVVDNTDPLNPVVTLPSIDESKWEIANINEFNLKVPTEAEWDAERLTWATNNASGAFGSDLKLTLAGGREPTFGDVIFEGTNAYYSSDTVDDVSGNIEVIAIDESNANFIQGPQSNGVSLRLIVDGNFTAQQFIDNYLNETVTINGLEYGFVYNSTTFKIWLDRNLGATQVATSATDTDAYGDLFQWGRSADGHEKRNSATTTTQATTAQPDHSDFIITHDNWLTPANDNLWQGVDGINNPALTQKLVGKNNLKASFLDLMDKPAGGGGGKIKIGKFWFDTVGNANTNTIEDGNSFEGLFSATRYVVGIVLDAATFDETNVDNGAVKLFIDNN